MPRRPAIISQADVARCLRAAKQEGAGEVRVQPDGVIVILMNNPNPRNPQSEPVEVEREIRL